jgi:hypothetical protein
VAGQGKEHVIEAGLFHDGARDVELMIPQRDQNVGSFICVA